MTKVSQGHKERSAMEGETGFQPQAQGELCVQSASGLTSDRIPTWWLLTSRPTLIPFTVVKASVLSFHPFC